jgi:hypothetical protein
MHSGRGGEAPPGRRTARITRSASPKTTARSHDEVSAFFAGLALVEPGVV